MLRTTLKLVLLFVLVVGGTAGLYQYELRTGAKAQVDEANRRTEQLRRVVEHIRAERRVADLIVTEQTEVAGVTHTTLLFVEYARDGSPLPAKRFTFEGTQAHLDAMVVKFEGKYVDGPDEPLRGQSVALFTRLFGDKQTPEQAHRIDEPGQIPAVYRGADPRVSEFEQALWRDFWRLADDAGYRKEAGVRVAQGEGLWRPFEPGKLYTVNLTNEGDLTITAEPLRGIYSEALKRNAAASAVKRIE
jgi:hypothetical protein